MAAEPNRPPADPATPRTSAVHATTAQDIYGRIDPDQFARHIRPIARRMVKDMINEIRVGVPEYALPLEGEFGKIIVTSVEKAVHQVIDNLGKPDADRSEWDDWFRHVGRTQFYSGWSMDAMQSAIRIGAQVAWRHLRVSGESLGVSADTLFTFADALFKYTDELAAVAVSGFTEAQARASNTIERRRLELHRLLLSEDPAEHQVVAELARATDWPLPEYVGVVALEYGTRQFTLPDPELDRDTLADLESRSPSLIMPDPERQVGVLEGQLGCHRVAIGPVVPVHQARRSFTCARRALELAARGVLPAEHIIRCTDHLAGLVVNADEFLLGRITEHALAPLDSLTVKQRARLSRTLLAWLGVNDGCVNDIAEQLGIHPQTVRYRMGRLRELFGDRLDDPEQRLWLEMALRSQARDGTGTSG